MREAATGYGGGAGRLIGAIGGFFIPESLVHLY